MYVKLTALYVPDADAFARRWQGMDAPAAAEQPSGVHVFDGASASVRLADETVPVDRFVAYWLGRYLREAWPWPAAMTAIDLPALTNRYGEAGHIPFDLSAGQEAIDAAPRLSSAPPGARLWVATERPFVKAPQAGALRRALRGVLAGLDAAAPSLTINGFLVERPAIARRPVHAIDAHGTRALAARRLRSRLDALALHPGRSYVRDVLEHTAAAASRDVAGLAVYLDAARPVLERFYAQPGVVPDNPLGLSALDLVRDLQAIPMRLLADRKAVADSAMLVAVKHEGFDAALSRQDIKACWQKARRLMNGLGAVGDAPWRRLLDDEAFMLGLAERLAAANADQVLPSFSEPERASLQTVLDALAGERRAIAMDWLERHATADLLNHPALRDDPLGFDLGNPAYGEPLRAALAILKDEPAGADTLLARAYRRLASFTTAALGDLLRALIDARVPAHRWEQVLLSASGQRALGCALEMDEALADEVFFRNRYAADRPAVFEVVRQGDEYEVALRHPALSGAARQPRISALLLAMPSHGGAAGDRDPVRAAMRAYPGLSAAGQATPAGIGVALLTMGIERLRQRFHAFNAETSLVKTYRPDEADAAVPFLMEKHGPRVTLTALGGTFPRVEAELETSGLMSVVECFRIHLVDENPDAMAMVRWLLAFHPTFKQVELVAGETYAGDARLALAHGTDPFDTRIARILMAAFEALPGAWLHRRLLEGRLVARPDGAPALQVAFWQALMPNDSAIRMTTGKGKYDHEVDRSFELRWIGSEQLVYLFDSTLGLSVMKFSHASFLAQLRAGLAQGIMPLPVPSMDAVVVNHVGALTETVSYLQPPVRERRALWIKHFGKGVGTCAATPEPIALPGWLLRALVEPGERHLFDPDRHYPFYCLVDTQPYYAGMHAPGSRLLRWTLGEVGRPRRRLAPAAFEAVLARSFQWLAPEQGPAIEPPDAQVIADVIGGAVPALLELAGRDDQARLQLIALLHQCTGYSQETDEALDGVGENFAVAPFLEEGARLRWRAEVVDGKPLETAPVRIQEQAARLCALIEAYQQGRLDEVEPTVIEVRNLLLAASYVRTVNALRHVLDVHTPQGFDREIARLMDALSHPDDLAQLEGMRGQYRPPLAFLTEENWPRSATGQPVSLEAFVPAWLALLDRSVAAAKATQSPLLRMVPPAGASALPGVYLDAASTHLHPAYALSDAEYTVRRGGPPSAPAAPGSQPSASAPVRIALTRDEAVPGVPGCRRIDGLVRLPDGRDLAFRAYRRATDPDDAQAQLPVRLTLGQPLPGVPPAESSLLALDPSAQFSGDAARPLAAELRALYGPLLAALDWTGAPIVLHAAPSWHAAISRLALRIAEDGARHPFAVVLELDAASAGAGRFDPAAAHAQSVLYQCLRDLYQALPYSRILAISDEHGHGGADAALIWGTRRDTGRGPVTVHAPAASQTASYPDAGNQGIHFYRLPAAERARHLEAILADVHRAVREEADATFDWLVHATGNALHADPGHAFQLLADLRLALRRHGDEGVNRMGRRPERAQYNVERHIRIALQLSFIGRMIERFHRLLAEFQRAPSALEEALQGILATLRAHGAQRLGGNGRHFPGEAGWLLSLMTAVLEQAVVDDVHGSFPPDEQAVLAAVTRVTTGRFRSAAGAELDAMLGPSVSPADRQALIEAPYSEAARARFPSAASKMAASAKVSDSFPALIRGAGISNCELATMLVMDLFDALDAAGCPPHALRRAAMNAVPLLARFVALKQGVLEELLINDRDAPDRVNPIRAHAAPDGEWVVELVPRVLNSEVLAERAGVCPAFRHLLKDLASRDAIAAQLERLEVIGHADADQVRLAEVFLAFAMEVMLFLRSRSLSPELLSQAFE